MWKSEYESWLKFAGMSRQLNQQLVALSEVEAEDCFYQSLEFGTGGLRGVLGAGINRMNIYTVSKATRGLGKYMLSHSADPSCAVSYDSRIQSHEFAELVSATLADMGIRVYLYSTLMPTPMLSYAVRRLQCDAGVMITASHNPAKFNGYKVYGADGCQITLEAADQIQGYIDRETALIARFPRFSEMLEARRISYIDASTIEAYYQAIQGLSVCACDQALHVVYSPLNGAGNVPVREILSRMGNVRVDVVAEQELPDGHFPTCPFPNPEMPEAMAMAIRDTLVHRADLCIATDPDCDRVGVGVRVGDQVQLLSGNDVGLLLLDYLCKHKRKSASDALPPVVVKTIVSTDMAVPICDQYGVELREVLTGFKFIGEQIAQLESEGHVDRFLLGFEESYGYLSGTEVRDKDAVNAAMLICEMAAYHKSRGKSLLDVREALCETYGYYEYRLLTFAFEGIQGKVQMNAILQNLRASASDVLEDEQFKIAKRVDYLMDDVGLPPSDVLSYGFSNGCKVILRPSGTEAKLKIYLTAKSETAADAQQKIEALAQRMNGLFAE